MKMKKEENCGEKEKSKRETRYVYVAQMKIISQLNQMKNDKWNNSQLFRYIFGYNICTRT